MVLPLPSQALTFYYQPVHSVHKVSLCVRAPSADKCSSPPSTALI